MTTIEQSYTVPGSYGKAFKVKKGQRIEITDLHGQQIVDFMAFKADDDHEYLSMSRTRLGLQKANFTTGDTLVTNFNTPFIKVISDDFGIHDSTYAACDWAEYERYGQDKNHRSCQGNFIENLADFGINEWRIPDPWNIFQNTPSMDSMVTGFSGESESSKAGDKIVLECLMDSIIAVSACPFEYAGLNGGKSTDILVEVVNAD